MRVAVSARWILIDKLQWVIETVRCWKICASCVVFVTGILYVGGGEVKLLVKIQVFWDVMLFCWVKSSSYFEGCSVFIPMVRQDEGMTIFHNFEEWVVQWHSITLPQTWIISSSIAVRTSKLASYRQFLLHILNVRYFMNVNLPVALIHQFKPLCCRVCFMSRI
jgi:hypothetical protein